MAYEDLSIVSQLIARQRGRAVLWETTTLGNGTWYAGWYGTAVINSGAHYGIRSANNAFNARINGNFFNSLSHFAGQTYQFCLILDNPGCRLLVRGAWDIKEWAELYYATSGTTDEYFGHNAVTSDIVINNIIVPAEDLSALLSGSVGSRLDTYLSPPPGVDDIYVVDNAELPTAYSAFPSLIRLPSGRLLCAYSNASGHSGTGDGKSCLRASDTDGKTWGAEVTIYDDDTYDANGPSITRLSDGSLIASFHTDERPASPSFRTWVAKSADDGATWGAPIEVVPPSLTDLRSLSAPVIQLANGDLLLSIYGLQSEASAYTAVTMKSSDGGATWGAEVIIAEPGTISYSEPNIVLLDNGTILALIRNKQDNKILTTTSADSGATWGEVTEAFDGNGSPHVIQLSDTRLIATNRRVSDNAAVYRVSEDRGATWGDEVVIHDFPRYSMMYASPCELANGNVGMAYGVQSTVYINDCDILYRELTI